MSNAVRRVDWRLIVLLGAILGAAAVQTLVAAGAFGGDAQLLAIGTAAIVMFVAMGTAAYLLRGGG